MRRIMPRRAAHGQAMPVTEHLDELRRRLVLSGAVLAAAFIAAYAWHDRLLAALVAPLPAGHRELLTLSPTEPFLTVLKIAFAAAVLATLPVLLYQLYAFVTPAVAAHTRRRALAVVGGVAALFAGGVAFGYLLVLPVALDFLLGFGADAFTTELRAGDYVAFALTMLLGAGLMFEVPVAMLAFARLGVVTADMYRRHWRVAVVVMAAVAAVLPGGDPLSMLLLMAPQVVLYAAGVALARAFGGAPLWHREAWSDEAPSAAPAG